MRHRCSRLLGRLADRTSHPAWRWAWFFVAVLWTTWLVSIGFIDTNIPLSASHFRPDGGAVLLWLTVAVLFVRFGALGAALGGSRRARRSADSGAGDMAKRLKP